MRQALSERTLQVFEEPSGVMHDTSRSLLERNDAFTAIRFGLAGLVMRAWEPTIVESCDAYDFGGGVITHRFKDTELFKPHDASVVDERRSSQFFPATGLSQGAYAFRTLTRDLQRSMLKILKEPAQYATGIIPVDETLQSIRHYVTQGKELGLTTVPDAFYHGEGFTEDFYRVNDREDVDFYYTKSDEEVDLYGLVSTARNPIRFTSAPITYLMNTSAVAKWRRQDGGHTFDAHPAGTYRPDQTAAMIRNIVLHAARASQRNDINRTVVDNENRGTKFSIQLDKHGKPEVYWPTKHLPPIRRLQEGQTPPADGLVSNRRRNKCPIGYTEKADDPMPIRGIYEAMIAYMVDANLHVPTTFVAPKIIVESLDSVH